MIHPKLLGVVRGDHLKAVAMGRSPGSLSFSAFEKLEVKADGTVKDLIAPDKCPDEYVVVERLGAGSNGTVDLVRSSDGKEFALKKVPFGLDNLESEATYFATEVYYNVKLSETGVAPDVFDWGMCYHEVPPNDNDWGFLFMVSERVGTTLEEHLKLHPFTNELAVSLAVTIDRMLNEGVSHGDLHPRNIMVDDQGAIRIIDYGRAVKAKGDLTKEFKEEWESMFWEVVFSKDWPISSVLDAARAAAPTVPVLYKLYPSLRREVEPSDRKTKRARALARLVGGLTMQQRFDLLR
jgi:serine/threonine protein kinase